MTQPKSPQLTRVITFFETISPASTEHIDALYSADAFFKDPFNEVRGLAEIKRIFLHMFVQVDGPRFIVTEALEQGELAFLVWEFRFRMKRFDTKTEQVIRGSTHIRFNAEGRVSFHRDYWDAAEELYEKLPVLGSLMRALKRMAG